MAAGPKAKPLGYEGWHNDKGKELTPEEAKKVIPRFCCNCGCEGDAGQLLTEDNDSTLWCPQCRLADWEWV